MMSRKNGGEGGKENKGTKDRENVGRAGDRGTMISVERMAWRILTAGNSLLSVIRRFSLYSNTKYLFCR